MYTCKRGFSKSLGSDPACHHVALPVHVIEKTHIQNCLINLFLV